jgi:hypothetical protein
VMNGHLPRDMAAYLCPGRAATGWLFFMTDPGSHNYKVRSVHRSGSRWRVLLRDAGGAVTQLVVAHNKDGYCVVR